MQMQILCTIHRRATAFISAVRYLNGLRRWAVLSAMKERNEKKAKILYDFLDREQVIQRNCCKGRPFPDERTVRNR